ncbi:MAG: CPBP family intramembrane metalloprotease [Chloroflexi bacterium]|nr:CPBP family intramembrane metalloprotease [Chloroflexota bacterium]
MKKFFMRGGRLRAGWRIALYLIASLIVTIVGSLGVGLLVGLTIGAALANQGVPNTEISARIQTMFTHLFDFPLLALSFQGARVLLGLGLIWLFRRWIDKREFRALGFQLTNGWWKEFGAGFVFILAMWVMIFALTLLTGAAQISEVGPSLNFAAILGALAFGLGFNLLVGIIEEADARGYILQNLAEGIRFAPAVIISSAYFAFLHRLNPGAGWGSTIGIFFAGITLAMGYYLTQRLWFSIGMHAAWNFAEGPVFGFLVSGLDMGGLFKINVTGPEWLMGGAFGPEAGALAVGVEVAAMMILIWFARRKKGTLVNAGKN